MDINDIIIIKFIVTYSCLSACSIHRYGEAIAHAQTARRKLKPHLLLGNCCHVEYFNLISILSLTAHWTLGWPRREYCSLLVKVTTLGTDFSWLSPCCRQSLPVASWATAMIARLNKQEHRHDRWEFRPERISWASLGAILELHLILQDQWRRYLILTVYRRCHYWYPLFVAGLSSCYVEGCGTWRLCYFLITPSVSAHGLVAKSRSMY